MILDKPEHRDILLELMRQAHFQGDKAREVVALMDAIENASVAVKDKPAKVKRVRPGS
jgi:hypothetical protein